MNPTTLNLASRLQTYGLDADEALDAAKYLEGQLPEKDLEYFATGDPDSKPSLGFKARVAWAMTRYLFKK